MKEMGKNVISKEQLYGYREPTKEEHDKIQQYMRAHLKKTGRLWKITKFFCVAVDAFLILGLLGMGGAYPAREKIVVSVLVFFLTVFIFLLNKWKKNDSLFWKKIYKGEFQVLDCSVYQVDFTVELVNNAVVYICTDNEQYCNERFTVDYISAKEWTQKKEVSFLLMKTVCEKDTFYELFTEKKLERR